MKMPTKLIEAGWLASRSLLGEGWVDEGDRTPRALRAINKVRVRL